MITQALLDYLKIELISNKSEDEIIQVLRKQGWEDNDINTALQQVKNENKFLSNKSTSPHLVKKLAASVLLFFIGFVPTSLVFASIPTILLAFLVCRFVPSCYYFSGYSIDPGSTGYYISVFYTFLGILVNGLISYKLASHFFIPKELRRHFIQKKWVLTIIAILIIPALLLYVIIHTIPLTYQRLSAKPPPTINQLTAENKSNFGSIKLATIPSDVTTQDNSSSTGKSALTNIFFSSYGNKVAYITNTTKNNRVKSTITIADKSHKKYPVLENYYQKFSFTPDGRHFAYIGGDMLNNSFFISSNGSTGKEYPEISQLVVSPDSKKIIFISGTTLTEASIQNKVIDVRNNVDFTTAPVFNTDSNNYAYLESVNDSGVDKYRAVYNNRKGKIYDEITGLLFSQDNKHFAYRATNKNGAFVVLDNKEGKMFDKVTSPTFTNANKIAYVAHKGSKTFLVTDSAENEIRYNKVERVAISPNGAQRAYKVKKTNDTDYGFKEFVAIDTKKGNLYDQIGGDIDNNGDPIFSPDSNNLAYKAKKGNKSVVVINGKESKEYDEIDNVIFYPDSQYVGFGARTGHELWWIVIPVTSFPQVTLTPTPSIPVSMTPSCIPGPPCVYKIPRCQIPEPVNRWCPLNM